MLMRQAFFGPRQCAVDVNLPLRRGETYPPEDHRQAFRRQWRIDVDDNVNERVDARVAQSFID